jgi:hypothetical protein
MRTVRRLLSLITPPSSNEPEEARRFARKTFPGMKIVVLFRTLTRSSTQPG